MPKMDQEGKKEDQASSSRVIEMVEQSMGHPRGERRKREERKWA